jgi:group I intron endonuclease
MIIYKAVNKINNKIYIGKTIRTLYIRKNGHFRDAFKAKSQTHFHKALRKYGEKSFEWSVIKKCKNIDELNESEKKFIKDFNTIKNGYNMTNGGDGGVCGLYYVKRYGKDNPFYGKHHTEKTKEILRNKNIGKFADDKNYFYGKHFTNEQNSFYGKHHTEKTKEIISDTNSKTWLINLPEGNTIIYKSLSKFCKENKLNYSSVKTAFRCNREYKGFTFYRVTQMLVSVLRPNSSCLS